MPRRLGWRFNVWAQSHTNTRARMSEQSYKVVLCPNCKADSVHRSRTRPFFEAWRRVLTGKRPHRCAQCGWRGWALDRGSRFSNEERARADRAVFGPPPVLDPIDLAEPHRSDFDPNTLDKP